MVLATKCLHADVSESNNDLCDGVTAGVEVKIDGPIKHLLGHPLERLPLMINLNRAAHPSDTEPC